MTRTGSWTRIILSLIAEGWVLLYALLPLTSKAGPRQQSRKDATSLPSQFKESRSGFVPARRSEENWISGWVSAQCIRRIGMSDLFIGGFNRKYRVFYCVHEMAAWFLDQGVPADDPVWDYIEQLTTTETA